MNVRSAGALAALAALAACKPAVKGLCSEQKDCRGGSYCSLDGICLDSSGTCAPACGDGELCSGSTCAALKPTVLVMPPAGPLSPAFANVTVHVDASPAIALHGIAVEVDSDQALASGSLAAPASGDNVVTLTSFKAGAVGNVSVRATLTYQPAGASGDSTLQSVALPATIDAAPPAVSVFVPPPPDAVNGWVLRTSATLEVRATVDDGAGSGAQAATLTFDTCPSAVACSYPGTIVSQTGGVTVFAFQVPRFAQAAGSEAPLSVTVTAMDVAGNQAPAAGVLQIDDAQPQIGPIALISNAGVTGEDGRLDGADPIHSDPQPRCLSHGRQLQRCRALSHARVRRRRLLCDRRCVLAYRRRHRDDGQPALGAGLRQACARNHDDLHARGEYHHRGDLRAR